jgi:signal transduction histidine kinase
MNAVIHAFKNGEQPGEIHIDLEKQGDTVRMVFSDNGVGIEPQTRDKIFEPFFTTRRGQGGSGLGLNIVYNIVIRQLGGRIRCESELGHYTQFIIEFSSASAGETL